MKCNWLYNLNKKFDQMERELRFATFVALIPLPMLILGLLGYGEYHLVPLVILGTGRILYFQGWITKPETNQEGG